MHTFLLSVLSTTMASISVSFLCPTVSSQALISGVSQPGTKLSASTRIRASQPLDTLDSRRKSRSVSCTEIRAAVEIASDEIASNEVAPVVPQGWTDFAAAVSGEWDGYCADFDSHGISKELPESAVPQAMKDWGVELRAWQTQSPTIARQDLSLYSKTIRLLPTVGCEADAATQDSIEEKECGGGFLGDDAAVNVAAMVPSKTVLRDAAGLLSFHREGSYVVTWSGTGMSSAAATTLAASKVIKRVAVKESSLWELEHCLVKEEMQDKSGNRKSSRVRILQQFERGTEGVAPILRGLSMYKENWEGEFRNGESLGGCSSNDSSFAEKPCVKREAIEGSWRGEDFRLICDSTGSHGPLGPSGVGELANVGTSELERTLGKDVILLPLGVWSQVSVVENGTYSVELGWLTGNDEALVSICQYGISGDLEVVSYSKQQRM